MKALLKTILLLVIVCSESESLESETCSTEGCKLGATEMSSWMDASVNPCENFYDFACGGFDKVHPLIEDPTKLVYHPSAFTIVIEEIYSQVVKILTSMSSTDEKYPKSVRFFAHAYQSCVKAPDLKIEEEAKLLRLLYEYYFQNAVANATWQNLWIYSQARSGFLIKTFLEVNISFNSSESHKRININLPKDIRFHEVFVPKQKPAMLSLGALICSMQSSKPISCQEGNLEKIVDEVINLELEIVSLKDSTQETTKVQGSKVFLKDVNSLVGFDFKHTLRKLFHIVDVLDRTDDPELEFSFSNVEYIKQLNKLLTNTSADILQAYFGWKLFGYYGGLLSRNIKNFTSILIDGSVENTQEDYCVKRVNEFMPKSTYLYIFSLHYLPDDYRAVAEQMVNDIKDVLKKNLETNDWLDEETRKEALHKLSKMGIHVGLPESMETYTEQSDTHYGMTDQIYDQLISAPNYLISLFKFALMIERTNYLALDQPTELDHFDSWRKEDFLPGARYIPESNRIQIDTPILRPSFFSADRLFIQNYGHLGTVIGHEFTHGFDPYEGAEYDADGRKRNWLSATAKERFQRRSECFKNDANSFKEPVTGLFVNGTRCLGEVVSDAGGLHLAYTSFQQRQKNEAKMWKLGEGLSNFTSEQLFFIAYAQNYCKFFTEKDLRSKLLTGVHPPDRYRVDGNLHNYDKWYDAFGCEFKKTNGMVMCKLW